MAFCILIKSRYYHEAIHCVQISLMLSLPSSRKSLSVGKEIYQKYRTPFTQVIYVTLHLDATKWGIDQRLERKTNIKLWAKQKFLGYSIVYSRRRE